MLGINITMIYMLLDDIAIDNTINVIIMLCITKNVLSLLLFLSLELFKSMIDCNENFFYILYIDI